MGHLTSGHAKKSFVLKKKFTNSLLKTLCYGKGNNSVTFFYFKNYLSNKINLQITSAAYFIQQGDPSEQQRKPLPVAGSNSSHFMSDIF